MNHIVGKARQRKPAPRDENLYLIGGRELLNPLKNIGGLVLREHRWVGFLKVSLCFYASVVNQLPLYALPTFILRNLDGAAPCPVPITCCGCPLPQFGVPHKVHSSREQIASSAFQNSVVMPE